MNDEAVLRRLAAAGAARATAGTEAATRRLAPRLADAFPSLTIAADADAIRLAAPGLAARVFGGRRRDPDPALAGLRSLNFGDLE